MLKEFILANCYTIDKTRLNNRCASVRWWIDKGAEGVWGLILSQTDFLSNGASFAERVFIVLNDICEHPICIVCGAHTKYSANAKKFNVYCSPKCGAGHIISREKMKITSLERYGYESPQKNEAVQLKTKATMIERFGVDNASKSPVVKERRTSTMIERFGVDNASKSPVVKERKRLTSLANYGVDYPLQSDIVKSVIKQTVFDKYGTYPMHSADSVAKKEVTNLFKYDSISPFGNQKIRDKIGETCIARYGTPHSSQRNYTSTTLNNIRNLDVGSLYDKHKNEETPVYVIANEIGVGYSYVSSLFKKSELTIKYFHTSAPQRKLFEYLVPYGVLLNDRISLSGKEIDILVPNYKLGIEVDGMYWHSVNTTIANTNHFDKIVQAQSVGIRLIRFTEDEINNKFHIVTSMMDSILGQSIKIYARKCVVRLCTPSEAKDFFNKNHIHGHNKASVYIGLVYDNQLVQMMSFGKSRYDSRHQWEVIRGATSCGVVVVGGSSRIFKKFKTDYNPISVISYVDKRYFTGASYQKMGFEYLRDTSPGYHYWKGKGLESRIKYQKHKLKDILAVYCPDKTEKENMLDNGYRIYYDCGHKVYSLTFE